MEWAIFYGPNSIDPTLTAARHRAAVPHSATPHSISIDPAPPRFPSNPPSISAAGGGTAADQRPAGGGGPWGQAGGSGGAGGPGSVAGLGPGTLVGSAAFDLFPIHAVCVVMPRAGSMKKISDLGVWLVELFWSFWAYIWLYIILEVWTPNVITLWEALLTVLQSGLLLVHAYAQDKRWPYVSIPLVRGERPEDWVPAEDTSDHHDKNCDKYSDILVRGGVLEVGPAAGGGSGGLGAVLDCWWRRVTAPRVWFQEQRSSAGVLFSSSSLL